MENLSSWIWLIVAVLWFVTKILPRLFRGKKSQSQAPTPRMADPAKPSSQTPTEEDAGPAATFDTLVASLGRSRGSRRQGDQAPPPIVPK